MLGTVALKYWHITLNFSVLCTSHLEPKKLDHKVQPFVWPSGLAQLEHFGLGKSEGCRRGAQLSRAAGRGPQHWHTTYNWRAFCIFTMVISPYSVLSHARWSPSLLGWVFGSPPGPGLRGQQNIRCDEVWHYCVLVSEIPEILEEFQRFLYMMWCRAQKRT